MIRLKILSCLICLHSFIGSLQGADKYTDGNRPYEFGFSIDGEQHRHEKKDENGIVMGEFGFITADGVYHVTVYATDENGRFKILSMKNIRVKPYPTAGDKVKKGHSIPFPPSENAPILQGPSNTAHQETKPMGITKQISSPAKSCSACSLPTTTTKAPPPQLTDIAVVSRDRIPPSSSGVTTYQQNSPLSVSDVGSSFSPRGTNIGNPIPNSGQQSNPSSPNLQQNKPQYPQVNYQDRNAPASGTNLNYPLQNNQGNQNQYYPHNQNNPQIGSIGLQNDNQYRNSGNLYNTQKEIDTDKYYPQPKDISNDNYPQSGSSFDQPPSEESSSNNFQPPKDTLRNPKQYNDVYAPTIGTSPPQGFRDVLASLGDQPVANNKPTLLAAQMQIVPKDTDVHHRNPGEEKGLPDGLSQNDMTNLLYTFNYTVGFHGHHEEGYSNGVKKGYYYVTGRNGIRTRVDYVADEKGFRPRISQEVLDIMSDDVPKPETEKDEKYGLKGYEFKWLYYPSDDIKH